MNQQVTNHHVSQNATSVERKGDRELVVTRTFDAAPPIVFKAWSDPELFHKWWVPEGAPMTLLSCDMDVRTGGNYRLEFGVGGQSTEFYEVPSLRGPQRRPVRVRHPREADS